MLNKKGYATLTVLIVILMVSSTLLLLFYSPILNTSKNVAESSLLSTEIIRDTNSKERLYSTLFENISYAGKHNYTDLKREYEVSTIDEDFQTIELHFLADQANGFTIENETDIKISLTATPINSALPYSYDVELKLKNKDILEGNGMGLQVSSVITVSPDKIYNKQTGETNYGSYMLNIPNPRNCNVSAVVLYEKLYYRKALIESDNFKKNITIENQLDKITVKFE